MGKAKTQSEPEMYEVEKILDKRLCNTGVMYLIKWRDFPDPKDYTWEPTNHLQNVQDMIQQFNEQFDKRSSRHAPKLKPAKPAKAEESEQEQQSEPGQPAPKRRLKRHLEPTEQKSDEERKHTSGNEDHDDEQPEERIVPRKEVKKEKESKKNKEPEPKKEKEVKKEREAKRGKDAKEGKEDREETQPDRHWEREGKELGRIHKHFLIDGKLHFLVNANKGELVCGMLGFPIDELRAIDEDKLVAYMENWAKNHLIEKACRTTSQYKEFEQFCQSLQ